MVYDGSRKEGLSLTIGEIARLTGVTIRTLRHYDHIGLLPPARITETGYRLYDEASLEKLQLILLFRELELPLTDIRRILEQPDFDLHSALQLQERLLMMRRGHIDRLIALTRTLQQKGMTHMDFSAFEKHTQDDYAAQAKAAWDETSAWQEYAARERSRNAGDSARYGQQLMDMLGEFGRCRPQSPSDPDAQAFIQRLQRFITEHFYTCTDEILSGLADMYETPDFRRNIDRAGGEGTAAFIAEAIRLHCAESN